MASTFAASIGTVEKRVIAVSFHNVPCLRSTLYTSLACSLSKVSKCLKTHELLPSASDGMYAEAWCIGHKTGVLLQTFVKLLLVARTSYFSHNVHNTCGCLSVRL